MVIRDLDVRTYDNPAIGGITYWVVIGNQGAVDAFNRNGGTKIRTRRIGASP